MLFAHHFTTLAFYFATLFSLQILSNHVQQSAMEVDVGSKEIDHRHKMFSSAFLILHCFVNNEEH
jgi:hypothetical protein